MEAAILTKKRKHLNKAKLKKTIKNVLCRPDPLAWPILSDDMGKELTKILQNYKIEIPEYSKPHWSVVKNIPKESRPKPPKLKKIDGLVFGISHCVKTITSKECVAVILDADITPQLLVHHVIDSCKMADIPFVCLKELKQNTAKFFGFQTCCLGVTKNINLKELYLKVNKFAKLYKIPNTVNVEQSSNINNNTCKEFVSNMEVIDKKIDDVDNIKEKDESINKPFKYLYRSSKSSRVFVPQSNRLNSSSEVAFKGQDFISIADKSLPTASSKKNKTMIIKRISNNPNRKRKLNT